MILHFVWTHILLMHDFKWVTFLDGPIFILSSYFETQVYIDEQLAKDPTYNGAGKMR
jgi:hypothetical protein